MISLLRYLNFQYHDSTQSANQWYSDWGEDYTTNGTSKFPLQLQDLLPTVHVNDFSPEISEFLSVIGIVIVSVDAVTVPRVRVGADLSILTLVELLDVSHDLTGCTKALSGTASQQSINPSELNLWRVIRKNDIITGSAS